MIWNLLPFGIMVILVGAILLAGSMVRKLMRLSKEQPTGKNLEENI